ncbi:YbaB/EbfC family nucleoid-associated protein [Actinoplanes sp. NPDC049118]|uniref:YbaB/EbfC family nucleoid-associated protein n=1 Tax=Actinoplanes sp. NPDC049118 TaxID=3155769 RepID=UPI0033FD90F8
MAYPHGGPPRPAPPGDDVFSRLRRVSVELRALSQATNAAVRPGARFEGRDGSGTVTVTVDGRQLVEQVHFDPRWDQRLHRESLGEALMQAYGEAVGELLTAGAQAFEEAARDVDDARLEQEAEDDLRSHRRRHLAPDELLGEVQDQLRQIEMLERYGDNPDVALPQRRDTSVTGPSGFLEITVQGGQIHGIRVLLSRLPAMATNGTLAQEALGAFRAAARAAQAAS